MVHESSNPEKEDEGRVSLTHANGAQVGVLCRRFSKLVDVGEVLEWNQRAAWKWECLCGVERTLSGRERTAPDPSFSVYRQVQPAETPTSSTYCSQIFISSLFVPGRPAADNPPAAYPGRDATSRPEQPTGVSRLSSEGAHAPINCFQPAETRRCIDHPGRWCWIWRGGKEKRHKAPNERFEERQRFN